MAYPHNEEFLKKLDKSFAQWFNGAFETPTMTKKLYPYVEMFSPIQVNRCTIKNRLVMAPMGNISMSEETGRPDARMIKYFEERAKGGVGLITTGLVPVSYGVDNSIVELGNLSYFPRIDRSRTVFSGWRDLSAAVHAHGSKIFLQVSAGLGRVGNPQCLVNSLKFPASASVNPNFYMHQVPCLRLSDGSCKKIIKQMGQAAADGKASNLDGVYLHGHEGYLLEQMTNPAFNRRMLGRYSDWQRFGVDTIKEIRRRVGANYPIMYRIDLSLALNVTYKDKLPNIPGLKKFQNERTIEQTIDYMKNLVAAGVDMFDVDLGCYDNWWLPHPPASMPSGCFLSVSELVKARFEKDNIKSNLGLAVPIVAVGKLGYPDLAEKALRDKKCDMVMLGRPLLADADWCNKAYAGDVEDIRPCIGCQEACINEFVEGGHPQCAVNPRCAFENDYPAEIAPAAVKKKIAVVGGGPAGMVSAITLTMRGHDVTLFEKTDALGGMLIPGGAPAIKYEFKNYHTYLLRQIERSKASGLKVELGKTVTADDLKKGKFDVVVVAAGGTQVTPKVPGVDGKNVYYGIDVLVNPKLLDGKKKIVVIGGGVVGCETAYSLRYEQDKEVTVVEMMPYFMNHTCTANRGHIIHYLEEGGVQLLNCTKLTQIKSDKVVLERNMSKTVPNPYITWAPILPENVENPLAPKLKEDFKTVEVACDAVVLSVGVRPSDKFFYDLVSANVAPEVYNVGDSFKAGKIFEATKAAYRKSLAI